MMPSIHLPLQPSVVGNWRELLERTNAEHKDKAASLSGRLKELYEAGKQIKDSRKAKVRYSMRY